MATMPSRCPGKDIRRMRNISLLISLVVITNVVSAQSVRDSIHAGYTSAVMDVVGSVGPKDVSQELIDAGRQKLYGLQVQHDIGTLLERSGVAVVNLTGAPGSSVAARFGGLSSDHSVIMWSGVPLNALSLGTCDLSMIPAFFTDHTVLHKNPPASEIPLAGLGMTLNLNSDQHIKAPNYLRVISGYNSLKNSTLAFEQYHSIGLDGKEGQQKKWIRSIGWRTRAMIQDFRNDFSYRDIYSFDSPVVSQLHNNAKSSALLNDVFINTRTGVFSLHHWFGIRKAMLPALMGKFASGTAEQDDQLNRSIVKWSLKSGALAAEVSSAYFDEELTYRDFPLANDEWGIYSAVRSRSLLNRVAVNYIVVKSMKIGFNAAYADQLVVNTNYEDGRSRLEWTQLTGFWNLRKTQWNWIVDAQYDSRIRSQGPAVSFSTDYTKKFGSYNFKWYAKIARRFRAPDMNELFWIPGGNADLLAESANTLRGGVEFNNESNNKLTFYLNPSVQYADVVNWIQWIPTESGYWAPVNYKSVQSLVIELPLRVTSSGVRQRFTAESRGILTNAVVDSPESNSGREMIYTPRLSYVSAFGYLNEAFSLSLRHRYMSARFTDEQNSNIRALPEYHVFGLSVEYDVNSKFAGYSIGLDIDNLFNHAYQSVRAFAIPGRIISMNLSIDILTNKKEKQNEN